MSFSDNGLNPTTTLPGYRLQKFEVYNWGTFDSTNGQVYSVSPAGQTALLIGQNGSGKSTLVDALLTLLVRPGVRNFNVAAGAKKRERDERSYILGAYDRSTDASGQNVQVKYLRPAGDHYSVILASFASTHSQTSLTIAQVLYLTADQKVEKIYTLADGLHTIRDDFSGFASTKSILKTLKSRGFRVTKSYTEFESWFQKVMHTNNKALEVFNQTVAVKDIHKLNDFIRQHMLEAPNWNARVERLLTHFSQLTEAHRSLIRTRRQQTLLQPVTERGHHYQQQALGLKNVEQQRAACDTFFAQQTLDIFQPEVDRSQDQLETTANRKDALANEIWSIQEDGRRLRNDIENAGGDRLKQIPLLIEKQQLQADSKRATFQHYHAGLHRAGIQEMASSATEFSSQTQQARTVRDDLARTLRDIEPQRDGILLELRDLRRLRSDTEQEWQQLGKRQQNLPEWCISMRQQLCDALKLKPSQIPFAAELIAVSPQHQDWQASIEQVLKGFALSLLVPEEHYQRVSQHVNSTRLTDARGRGQRLVYLRVTDHTAASTKTSRNSLVRKLQFDQSHPLATWVQQEVQRKFNYECCDTIEEFQAVRGSALTKSRHSKSGWQRHDKDDRDTAGNPRNYVLGWDNHAKRDRIAEEVQGYLTQESQQQQQLSDIDRQIAELRQRIHACDEILSVTGFNEIDYQSHQNQIELLQQEQQAIENDTDAVQLLKQRLADREQHAKKLQAERDELVAEERELQNQIQQAETLIRNARKELKARADDGSLSTHELAYFQIEQERLSVRLTLDNFFTARDVLRRDLDRLVVDARKQLEPMKDAVVEAMARFLREFPEETELRPHVDYLPGFSALAQRILEEDLPRHEARFKERLNEKVLQEVGLFRGDLEKERRDIEDKIETLNVSLRRLEYRPGTHVQLEPRSVRDPEIVDFQQQLRACAALESEQDDVANEAHFLKIEALIERFQDENQRRWRDKVTDVRRWFDFAAAVVDRHSLDTVSIYEDSSGQSGGEKAKLAFTILVAAIAYQYDIDPEHPSGDRFQFVVVDEMFSKVDDQHAEYALKLFEQFGLQLLIVAPLDAKARVTQPYVGSYLHVNKRDNHSEVFEMSAREFADSTNSESLVASERIASIPR